MERKRDSIILRDNGGPLRPSERKEREEQWKKSGSNTKVYAFESAEK